MRTLSGKGTLEDLSCETIEEYEELLSWLSVERWKEAEDDAIDVAVREGVISEEDGKKAKASESTFDLLLDFDAYYADFRQYYGINLLKEEVGFFEFKWLLSALSEKDDSVIIKRSRYRSYTKGKDDAKYAQYMYSQRKKYALSADDAVFKDNFDQLFAKTDTLGGT